MCDASSLTCHSNNHICFMLPHTYIYSVLSTAIRSLTRPYQLEWHLITSPDQVPLT